MTIEELFGTLQQSVVATWRKHLRTAKYSKHTALNDFYEEMPEKVDALIEAWMGANGKKIKSYDNILKSKNMNTLSYLKELRKIVKQGYELMNGEKELEALLDDIVELIDSTLYKVKELNENKLVDLKDFIKEALVNETNYLTAKSKRYLEKKLGFNPAAIDYKKTRAWDNFEKFANADKLSELFNYLVSRMSRKHEYTQSQWIDIIADMDIDDYEKHKGPLQTYNGLRVVRESVVNEANTNKCLKTIARTYNDDGDLVSVASCFNWLDELGWEGMSEEEYASAVHDINDDVDEDAFYGFYSDCMMAMVEVGRKVTLDFIKKISSKEEMDDFNINYK